MESGFPKRCGSDSGFLLGSEASRDDATLFGRPSRTRATAGRARRDDPCDPRDALKISPFCVSKWKELQRETGSLKRGKIGGHKTSVLSGATAEWLRERVRSGPFTLRMLTAELAARGIKTHQKTVWLFVHAEGLRKRPRGARVGPEARRLERRRTACARLLGGAKSALSGPAEPCSGDCADALGRHMSESRSSEYLFKSYHKRYSLISPYYAR
jgi:putative transposase